MHRVPLCDLDNTDTKLFDSVALYLFCLLAGTCLLGKGRVGLGLANWTHVHLCLAYSSLIQVH